MPSRYIINHNPDGRLTIHDRTNLDERCNVDDIKPKHRGETDTARGLALLIREGFQPCSYCLSGEESKDSEKAEELPPA